jgi:hypothetical protein
MMDRASCNTKHLEVAGRGIARACRTIYRVDKMAIRSRDGRCSNAAATSVATPALALECPIGPPAHEKGPRVWMDLDQVELDAAYDQSFYAPLGGQIRARLAGNSELARARLGPPRREA